MFRGVLRVVAGVCLGDMYPDCAVSAVDEEQIQIINVLVETLVVQVRMRSRSCGE